MHTHIDIAKYAANLTVQAVATKISANLIVNNTRAEEGDITVAVTSAVAGFVIADALRERTDEIVIKVAAWLAAKKASHA